MMRKRKIGWKRSEAMPLLVKIKSDDFLLRIVEEKRISEGKYELAIRIQGRKITIIRDKVFGIFSKDSKDLVSKEMLKAIGEAISNRYRN